MTSFPKLGHEVTMMILSTLAYKILVTSNSNQVYLNLYAKFAAPMMYGYYPLEVR